VHDSTKFLIFMFSMHIEQASLEQQTQTLRTVLIKPSSFSMLT